MTPLFPLAITWLAGAALLLADGTKRSVALVGAAAMATALLLDAILLLQYAGQSYTVVAGHWPPGIGIRLHVDGLSLFFATISAASMTTAMLHEALRGVRGRLFPALVLLLGAGLHGAFFTGDLFNFYVFFELSVVSSFALAAYGYGRAEIRGTFVYLAFNLFGSVLFLLGVASIYHQRGTLDLAHLTALSQAEGAAALILPATLIFVSLSLKLGLFPFHGWVPVLYSHAWPAVAAVMSGALINLAAYGLVRLGYSALAESRMRAELALILLGLAGCLYAAVVGLRRRRTGELLAYAAIIQAGFIVLCIGIGGANGLLAVLLVALASSLDKTTLFLSLESTGPQRRLAALIGALGIAGMPVTTGFVEKIQLFRAALHGPLVWIVMPVLVATSILLLATMIRFTRMDWQRADSRVTGYPALLTAGASVLLAIFAAPVIDGLQLISGELLGGQP